MGKKQVKVNALYFGGFFLLLILTSASAIFTKIELNGSRAFFFAYAAGQAAFEILAFIFLQSLIRHFFGRIPSLIFIGATFVFFVLHLLDFFVDRILDLSVWETIGFVLDESWTNFLYLLDASGVPLWVWAIAFSLVLALPLIGITVHIWTEKILRPVSIRREWLFQAFFCIPAALLFWEYSASPALLPDSYTSFLQSLPWKWTFLQPRSIHYDVPGPLKKPIAEHEIQAYIAKDETKLESLPNVYLFIVESLREDVINQQAAPELNRFKKNAASFETALSNGNGSHPAWFSIFHSQFSYAWKHLQSRGWTMGSPPLALLKKWGYKVRLYSSAQLSYYGMENLLFGKERNLIDSYRFLHHKPPLTAAETDAQTLALWKEDLEKDEKLAHGQIVIFFWDSTHFNYSWPEDWDLKFSPICHDIDYFNLFQSQSKIEQIKNRYRNAVYYMDSLFGKFLRETPDLKNAIVVFTGDHGEEFFERGHLFHGSHLSHEQTNIPLYMKFGDRPPGTLPAVVSQMDIFPSILHFLSEKEVPFLEGRSIFSKKHWPYAIISRFNAGRAPYEFCFHNGRHKLIARFSDRKNIFRSKSLQIRSLWSRRDICLGACKTEVADWVKEEFGPAIGRLFQGEDEL